MFLNRSQSAHPIPPAQEQSLSWYRQGESLANSGQYEEALNCFERSLKIRANDVDALIFKGVVLIHLERYEEALMTLDRALATQPGHTEALIFRGAALNHLGRYDECYQSYEEALHHQDKPPVRRQSFRWLDALQSTLHRLRPRL